MDYLESELSHLGSYHVQKFGNHKCLDIIVAADFTCWLWLLAKTTGFGCRLWLQILAAHFGCKPWLQTLAADFGFIPNFFIKMKIRASNTKSPIVYIIEAKQTHTRTHFRNWRFEIKKSVQTCDIAQSIPIYMQIMEI